VRLTAVPAGIDKDDLYAAKHPAGSIGYFSKIEIETNSGKMMSFRHGSFLLCEGSSFLVK
jgi:hypothetical protein